MSGSAALAAAKRRRVGPDMGNVVLSNDEGSANVRKTLSTGEALEVHEKKLDQLYNFHLSNRERINDIEELLKELCAQHNSSVDEMKKLDVIIKDLDVNAIQNVLETKQAERDSNLETIIEEKLGVFQAERDSSLEMMRKKLDEKDEELILIKKDMGNLNTQIKNLQEIIESQQIAVVSEENNNDEEESEQIAVAPEENNDDKGVSENIEILLKENNELFGETPVALEKPKTDDIKEKPKSAGTKRGRGRKSNKNAVDSKIPRCAEKDEIAVENIIFDKEEKTIDEKNEK